MDETFLKEYHQTKQAVYEIRSIVFFFRPSQETQKGKSTCNFKPFFPPLSLSFIFCRVIEKTESGIIIGTI